MRCDVPAMPMTPVDKAHAIFNLGKSARHIRRRLRAYMTPLPRIQMALGNGRLSRTDIRVVRIAGGYRVETQPEFFRSGLARGAVRAFSATWIYWLAQADPAVPEIVADVSDGDHPGFADFTFSSFLPEKVLMPDAHFFRDRGYAATRDFAAQNPVDWDARSDDIVWRGGMNGAGLISDAPLLRDHPGVNQRLRMVAKGQELGLDTAFVPGGGYQYEPYLRQVGLMRPRVPANSWIGRKYAIDIDGFSNAWDNLLTHFHLGNCVFKVGSNFGYRQWYYERLEPFRHFIPVRADMSDLEEKVDWARSHDREAREIAHEGQGLARSLTWDSERAEAGERITRKVLGG